MSLGFAVVTTGAVTEIDLVHEACFFQVAQRVINGGVTDRGQTLTCSLKDIAGGWMVLAFPDDLKNRVPLRCQLLTNTVTRFSSHCSLHNGVRLILNNRNCQEVTMWAMKSVP